MPGWPVGLGLLSVSSGEEVRLGNQILLSIHYFPHVVPLFQKHPVKPAVHRAASAHLLVVLEKTRHTNTVKIHEVYVQSVLIQQKWKRFAAKISRITLMTKNRDGSLAMRLKS